MMVLITLITLINLIVGSRSNANAGPLTAPSTHSVNTSYDADHDVSDLKTSSRRPPYTERENNNTSNQHNNHHPHHHSNNLNRNNSNTHVHNKHYHHHHHQNNSNNSSNYPDQNIVKRKLSQRVSGISTDDYKVLFHSSVHMHSLFLSYILHTYLHT